MWFINDSQYTGYNYQALFLFVKKIKFTARTKNNTFLTSFFNSDAFLKKKKIKFTSPFSDAFFFLGPSDVWRIYGYH